MRTTTVNTTVAPLPWPKGNWPMAWLTWPKAKEIASRTEEACSNTELFFDLVYVVIIHNVTEPLENTKESVLPWAWARVALLTITMWVLWAWVNDMAATARYFVRPKHSSKSQAGPVPFDFVVDGTIFLAMVFSALMARA